MTDKTRALEKANYQLSRAGMKAQLTEIPRVGLAIIIPDVYLRDLDYNNQDKQNPNQKRKVHNVPV